jgi:hypothetical protein
MGVIDAWVKVLLDKQGSNTILENIDTECAKQLGGGHAHKHIKL